MSATLSANRSTDSPPTVRVDVEANNDPHEKLSCNYPVAIDPSPPSESTAPGGSVETADPFPPPGATFLGFQLVEELGRGAFGRVYLAHQGELGGRAVALKVARDIFGESQKLAQLQHSNIVPIYSYHRVGPLQAVCMPYFGRT